MKKITEVEIENFQSHKKTCINFSNFSVILGHTDAGKSAIIRALKWCLFNLPEGTKFIRHKETYCMVKISFDDNTSIVRYRGVKENWYKLISSENEIHLESFGSGPVDDVMNFHGMRESNIFGARQILNICDQHTPPFFLTSSPGDRAAMIGQIAHTDIIDRAIKNTAHEIKDKKSEIKNLKGQLSDTNNSLKPYSEIKMLEKSLKNIFKLKERISNRVKILESAKKLKSDLEDIVLKKAKLDTVADYKDNVSNNIKLIEKLEESFKLYNNGVKLNKSLSKNRERQSVITDLTEKFSIDNIDEHISKLNQLLEKITRVQKGRELKIKKEKNALNLEKVNFILPYEEKINCSIGMCDECLKNINYFSYNLMPVVDSLNKVRERLKKGEAVISELSQSKDKMLQDYKEEILKNPQCPICNSQIDKNIVSEIRDIV